MIKLAPSLVHPPIIKLHSAQVNMPSSNLCSFMSLVFYFFSSFQHLEVVLCIWKSGKEFTNYEA
jgi:hypothetical protein